MSVSKSVSQSRSEVLIGLVRRMLHEVRVSESTFTANVKEHYEATVPLEARTAQFLSGGDLFRTSLSNAQKLSRVFEASRAREMCDLEESIVAAMPEPYRSQARTQLFARYDALDVPIPLAKPEGDQAADMQAVSRMTQEFGAAFEKLAPIVGDATINADDEPYLSAAIEELVRVEAAVRSVRARMEHAAAAVRREPIP